MNIAYWIVTVLVGLFMAGSGVPDIMMIPEAVEMFRHMGYPSYLLPFLGVAKILGGITIIQPFLPRLKEWAYAGLAFDLIGAIYSHLVMADYGLAAPPTVGLALLFISYFLYRKRLASTI